jgi:transcriptional regulator with XRE-family HTH domain
VAESDAHAGITPNQLVAVNLYLARTLRGWTQEQAAAELEPHLGVRWSKASYSAAERSAAGDRIRQFTADDLWAFSKAFDLPLTWFLLPPRPDEHGRRPAIRGPGSSEELDPTALLIEKLFYLGEDTRKRLPDLLADIPDEELTEVQEEVVRWIATYTSSLIASTLGELRSWQSNLRKLADYLGAVSERVGEHAVEEALQAVEEVYGDSPTSTETTASEAAGEAEARAAADAVGTAVEATVAAAEAALDRDAEDDPRTPVERAGAEQEAGG